jgi:tetratricopeptide (TPR) repeat protein
MIDMQKIDKLLTLMRSKNWAAAHAMLDENEVADPGEQTVAHWRAVLLREEGRYEEVLKYLADNLDRFNCKTSVFHKRAVIFHKMGNDSAALKEIQKAPFDAEIEDDWALVMDAKFFYLYLMVEAGLPISSEQWAEIPDDYISLMPTGDRVSKEQLTEIAKRQ